MVTSRVHARDEGNIDRVESNVTREKGKFSEQDFILGVSQLQPSLRLKFNPHPKRQPSQESYKRTSNIPIQLLTQLQGRTRSIPNSDLEHYLFEGKDVCWSIPRW
jgi:hypothetical protein